MFISTMMARHILQSFVGHALFYAAGKERKRKKKKKVRQGWRDDAGSEKQNDTAHDYMVV